MKKSFKSLTSAFNHAVVATTVFLSGCAGLPSLPLQTAEETARAQTGAPLTEGEKSLAAAFFGNSIDLSIVQKKIGKCSKSDSFFEVFDERTIVVCSPEYFSRDFSAEKNSAFYKYFMHEMTHIWQFQKFGRGKMDFCTEYSYHLDKSSRFENYCIEQQASMVADYAKQFFYPEKNDLPLSSRDENDLLKKVVEKQFPEAGKTRLSLSANKPPRGMPPS